MIYQVFHQPELYDQCTTAEFNTPIGAGPHTKDFCEKNNIPHDTLGEDNIGHWNDCINEWTCMYWAWKNLETNNSSWIGISHYRRSMPPEFRKNNNYLVERLLTQFDLISTFPCYFAFTPQCKVKGLAEAILLMTSEVYPEIKLNNLIKFGQEKLLHPFANCIITNKELYNHYCKWAWPIIEAIMKKRNSKKHIIGELDLRGPRNPGFMAERLFPIYAYIFDLNVGYCIDGQIRPDITKNLRQAV